LVKETIEGITTDLKSNHSVAHLVNKTASYIKNEIIPLLASKNHLDKEKNFKAPSDASISVVANAMINNLSEPMSEQNHEKHIHNLIVRLESHIVKQNTMYNNANPSDTALGSSNSQRNR